VHTTQIRQHNTPNLHNLYHSYHFPPPPCFRINNGGSKQEQENQNLSLKKCRLRLWLLALADVACPHYHGEATSDNWYALDELWRDQSASNERWVDMNCSSSILYPLCLLHLLISQFRSTSTDPFLFLYYSITGARGAISLKELDLSKTTKYILTYWYQVRIYWKFAFLCHSS
jgi:hypothetical protein